MRPVFCDVRIDLSRMRNACGMKQFALTTEQRIDIWDEMRSIWPGAKIDDDEISMGNCSSADIRTVLNAIEEHIRPHGYMMSCAVWCVEVRDLDMDGPKGLCISADVDLTGFEESDWTDEEASE